MSYRAISLAVPDSRYAETEGVRINNAGTAIGLARGKDALQVAVVLWATDGSVLSSLPFVEVGSMVISNVGDAMFMATNDPTKPLTPFLVRNGQIYEQDTRLPGTIDIAAMRDDGLVFGTQVVNGKQRAFFCQLNEPAPPIAFEVPGGVDAAAVALTETGDFLITTGPFGDPRGFVAHGGKMIDLGPYIVKDINNVGQVCAYTPDFRPFILTYEASGNVTATPIPTPLSDSDLVPTGINDAGHVVGFIELGILQFVGYFFDGSTTRTIADFAGVPGPIATAHDVNADDAILAVSGKLGVVLRKDKVPDRRAIDARLWEIVLTGIDAAGIHRGLLSHGVAQLPSGSVVRLPVIPIHNGATPFPPRPLTSTIAPAARPIVLAVALREIAAQFPDPHVRSALEHAATEILAHVPAPGADDHRGSKKG